MKLLDLAINDFRSYEKAMVEFSSGQNYIFGKNWQGKTSVMDAIGFALFGRRAFPTKLAGSPVKAQHLVHEGKSKGSVRLRFEHNGKRYLLSRECPKENSTLTSESKTLGSTSATVREALHELLGLDEDLFASVFYSEQDDLRRALDITPEARKVFIETVLGFGYLKEVKLNAKHASLGLQNWLDGFMSGNIKTAVEMEKEIGENVGLMGQQLSDLDKQLAGLKDVDGKKTQADKDWSDISEKHLKLAELTSTLTTRENILDETVEGISTGKCPTCTQPIPRDLKFELLEKFKQSMKRIDAELKIAKTEFARVEAKLSKAQENAENLEFQIQNVAEFNASKEQLGKQIDTETKRWTRLKNEVKAYENKHTFVKSINETRGFLDDLQIVLDEFRGTLRSSVTSDLENGVNVFMNRFSDGDFDARLNINEEFGFDIILHDRQVPLFNLSGAARDILALSLRYALYKIASKELNFLLLDEPTHHFDLANTVKLKSALDELGDQQLIIITVHDEFFDAVGKKFIVEKDGSFNSIIREFS